MGKGDQLLEGRNEEAWYIDAQKSTITGIHMTQNTYKRSIALHHSIYSSSKELEGDATQREHLRQGQQINQELNAEFETHKTFKQGRMVILPVRRVCSEIARIQICTKVRLSSISNDIRLPSFIGYIDHFG
jgi:hypothetical protein